MFDGLISARLFESELLEVQKNSAPTSMDDPMNIIQITQPLQHRVSDETDDIDIDCTNLPAYSVEGAFVHELHAYADVRISQKGSEAGNDVLRVTVVQDLQFSKNLFSNRRLGINHNDLVENVCN